MQDTVLQHIVKKLNVQIATNCLTDKDFSQFSWLTQKESIYNTKGEKISKSWYYEDKEAIRIVYSKIFGDFTYNKKVYTNIFLGVKKTIHWVYWDGTLSPYSKPMQPYYFNLVPVDVNDLTKGFTSLKMRKILSSETKNITL